MLSATQEEIDEITTYVEWQAPDLEVTFCQKVHSEIVIGQLHDIWDVHTSKDRWWVITNHTNLYSQDLFPNMDLALTFHLGLMLRIPRSEKPVIAEAGLEPFNAAHEAIAMTYRALSQAAKVSDYQTVGVRCREALLTFTSIAQGAVPWTSADEAPKKSDFKAWVEHVCNVILPSENNKDRRQLFKTQLNSAWAYANWLTHSGSSRWHDAEAAVSVTETAMSLCVGSILQHIRRVPAECPKCGEHRLMPLRAEHPETPNEFWESPACTACDWTGKAVRISSRAEPPEIAKGVEDTECVIPSVPLRKLIRPGEERG